MNIDWNSFKLFDDTAVLDKSILQVDATNGLAADITRFKQWIINLRNGLASNQPNHCGIPQNYVTNVTQLLDRFFPIVTDSNNVQTVTPLSISYNLATDGINYTANPIPVELGNSTLLITDGPAALGYIFSIQTAQIVRTGAIVPSYNNYAVPLLVIYSRCLYLAYITYQVDVNGNPSLDNTTVPWMSCVMYINNANANFPIITGSTYICSDSTDPNNAVLQSRLYIMMDWWRRQSVIDPGLKYYNPAKQLPLVPPRALDLAAQAFWRGFQGIPPTNGAIGLATQDDIGNSDPITLWPFNVIIPPLATQGIRNQVQLAFRAAFPNVPMAPFPAEKLGTTKRFKPVLNTSLATIINLRNSANYNRDADNIKSAFLALFRFWFIPRMFQPNPAANVPPVLGQVPAVPYDLSKPEYILPDQTVIDGLLAPLWATYKDATLDLLDQICWWVSRSNPDLKWVGSPGVVPYGRCAESYPVTALLPDWTPPRVLPNSTNVQPNPPPVSTIRGFSFKNRRFGATNDLYTTFSSQTLNTFHGVEAVYKLPCDNCQTLLPTFDIPVGQTNYDADLWSWYPAGAGNVT